MKVTKETTKDLEMIISEDKDDKPLFYSSILWFFKKTVSTCAVVYLRTYYDPWCNGTILHRGFAIVQGAPNLGSLQINFPGWMFLRTLMYWEFKP